MSGLSLRVTKTELPGVLLVNGDIHKDDRGDFGRIYSQDILASAEADWTIRQASISKNKLKYTLRGFHYQKDPKPEDKLIVPLTGSVYDVVVDLRVSSPTYLQWRHFTLSAERGDSIIVPKGCANAWMTLEDETMVLYNMSEYFDSSLYAGIRYNDPLFNVQWPSEPKFISEKDLKTPDFRESGSR